MHHHTPTSAEAVARVSWHWLGLRHPALSFVIRHGSGGYRRLLFDVDELLPQVHGGAIILKVSFAVAVKDANALRGAGQLSIKLFLRWWFYGRVEAALANQDVTTAAAVRDANAQVVALA